jgi:hypothetical protein
MLSEAKHLARAVRSPFRARTQPLFAVPRSFAALRMTESWQLGLFRRIQVMNSYPCGGPESFVIAPVESLRAERPVGKDVHFVGRGRTLRIDHLRLTIRIA